MKPKVSLTLQDKGKKLMAEKVNRKEIAFRLFDKGKSPSSQEVKSLGLRRAQQNIGAPPFIGIC